MNIISAQEFRQKKTSDAIFILGSGSSINKITAEEWDIIGKHNSIGFNWFCKHSFEPTFFLVREQANLPQRKHKGETIKTLIKSINRYKKTCCILCSVKHHTPRAYDYTKDKRIKAQCVVIRDNNNKRYTRKLNKYFKRDPFEFGLLHGRCTMYNVMHLIAYLDYKFIIFVGVDLHNSRYFWLNNKETRYTLSRKKRSYKNRHPVAQDVCRLVKKYKKQINDNMYVINRKSLLTSIIPHKKVEALVKEGILCG